MVALPMLLRLSLRYIERRFLQSLFFIVGVALGVAVMIAIDIANGSASRAFALSTESITGKATHQIRGGPAGLPSDLYAAVRLELGLRESAPIILEYVRAAEIGQQPLRLLGVDPFAEPPFRDYLSDVTVDGDEDAFSALTRFIAEPGTVLISADLAARHGLGKGDTLTISARDGRTQARILGLLTPPDSVSRQALDDLVLTDIATAQEMVGLAGRITRIDLILPDNYDTEALLARLPDNATLIALRGDNDALQQLTAAFEINLQALSLLALVVGVFLIYNTVTFSVVQRRPVIGILRSLGMTRDQVFTFILGEAVILGGVGIVLGLGLGVIFGRLAVGLVAQTISDLYFTVNVQSITVTPFTLMKGAGIGLLASVGAALVPSWSATRTPPAGTLRRSQFEESARRLVPLLTIGGGALIGCGILLLGLPTQDLFISFGALFCIIVGGALFTPSLLVVGMWASRPLTGRLWGVVGRMAPRAIVRSLSRTSVAVAALTIAVSVIVGVSVMISSFRSTVDDWLTNTLGADIFISPPALTANRATVDVDPLVMDIIAGVAGVERLSAARNISAIAPDYPNLPPANVLASSFDIAQAARRFVWTQVPAGEHQRALDAGQIMVSEPFAFRRGITPDKNTIRLMTDRGVQTFTIFGVYYDYSTDQGSIYMSRQTYARWFDDPFISSVAVFVSPNADVQQVMNALRVALADYDMTVQSNRDLRASALEVFDRTFTITIALRLLATIVAFIGILAALMALQLEHTREYGVMRASGMTPVQLWRYTLLQTGLMGLVAGVLALPIGLALALVLIYVINVRSFGWTMQLAPSPSAFGEAFAVAIIASLLAGLYPAWKLTQLSPSRALRSE